METEKILLRPRSFFDERDIEVWLGKEVVNVDHMQQSVFLSDGQTVKYDSLLIASGGSPKNFWPNTKSMRNVFVVRGANDAKELEKSLCSCSNG